MHVEKETFSSQDPMQTPSNLSTQYYSTRTRQKLVQLRRLIQSAKTSQCEEMKMITRVISRKYQKAFDFQLNAFRHIR